MGLAKCSKWMFWARGRAHCSLVRVNARAIVLWAKYVNVLRACWDRILCTANGTAERVRCAMWGVVLSSGAILAVGARVIGGTVPGVLFRVILRWSLGVIFSIRFAVGLRDCRIVHQFFVARYHFPSHWMDHGIGKVFEVDVLGTWVGLLQFGWGECRRCCIMGHVCEHAQALLGHNIVHDQWDS